MIFFDVIVNNRSGLHARPAKCLVSTARQFASGITAQNQKNQSANLKSIFEVLGLGAVKGTGLTIMVDGADEEAAAMAIKDLFMCNLGEEEAG